MTKSSNLSTSAKSYWLKNKKKVQLILPLLIHRELVINFLEKANTFNDFLRQQVQPILNDSILLSMLTFCKNRGLNDTSFNYHKTLKVIQSLDPNKPHGQMEHAN